MQRLLKNALVLGLLSAVAWWSVADSIVINGGRTFLGTLDASSASRSFPCPVGASTPAACTTGQCFFDSDATAGANTFLCTSGDGDGTNDVWTAITASNLVCTDCATLGSETSGDYVASATASQGLLITGAEGASVGLIDCAANEILKRNVGDTAWVCAVDETVGGGGTTNYSQAFETETSVVLTHSLGTKNVIVACYDASDEEILPSDKTIAASPPYDVTVTFQTSRTGRCVVNGTGQGPTGATGPQGDPGLDGSDGAPGAPGADGTDGLNCWDQDGDGTQDGGEDLTGDGTWDARDCGASISGTPTALAMYDADGTGLASTDATYDGTTITLSQRQANAYALKIAPKVSTQPRLSGLWVAAYDMDGSGAQLAFDGVAVNDESETQITSSGSGSIDLVRGLTFDLYHTTKLSSGQSHSGHTQRAIGIEGVARLDLMSDGTFTNNSTEIKGGKFTATAWAPIGTGTTTYAPGSPSAWGVEATIQTDVSLGPTIGAALLHGTLGMDTDRDGTTDTCMASAGGHLFDDHDCDGTKDGGETDLDATSVGPQGNPGADGLNCWDLDADGTKDNGEDVDQDGTWNADDCKGPQGDPGADSTVQGPQGDPGPQGNPTTLSSDSGSASGATITIAGGTNGIDTAGDGTSTITLSLNLSEVTDAVADGTTRGIARFTAADFDSDGSGRISIDGTTWATRAAVPSLETDSAHDTCGEISGCVPNAITAGQVPANETDAAHDTCAEVSGCVVNAITAAQVPANETDAAHDTFAELGGSVTDGQVPDNITISLAANATTWNGLVKGTMTDTKYCTYTAAGTTINCDSTPAGGAGGNSFSTIDAPAGTDPIADSTADTLQIVDGAGIDVTGDATNDTLTFTTDSTEQAFLAAGALTCGASTNGKMQVHTTPLQYCDNAATPTLRYAAYGDSDGNASVANALDTTGASVSVSSAAPPVANQVLVATSATQASWAYALLHPVYGTRRVGWGVPVARNSTTLTTYNMIAPSVQGTNSSHTSGTRMYVKFASAASTNSEAGVRGNTGDVGMNFQPIVSAVISTDTAITTRRVLVGMGDSSLYTVALTTGTSAGVIKAAWVAFDTAISANWLCCACDGSNYGCTSTGVAVATSTEYTLSVDYTTAGHVICTVNGTATDRTTNVPTASDTGWVVYNELVTLDNNARNHFIARIGLEQN